METTTQTQTAHHQIQFTITSTPSRSKGWARWSAQVDGQGVLSTQSGTQWGSGRQGDTRVTRPLEDGACVELALFVALRHGKYKQEKVYEERVRIVAREGATCEVEHVPGSQGLRLQITGAELAE